MFKKYKFDIVFAVLGVAAGGIAAIGVLFALYSLTSILTFMGLTFLPPVAVASTILVAAGVAFGLKKKDKE